jgi:hypothetical protein
VVDLPSLQPIVPDEVERRLGLLAGRPLYLHLETTAGAYAEAGFGAFVRNVPIRFRQAAVRGEGPYRVGLRIEDGWVYAEGLTEWTLDAGERLLLAGRDAEDRLTVALELAPTPFPV